MSDILDRAHMLSEGHKLCQLPDDGRDALALLPELIAEIKSLRGHLGEELAKNKDLSDAVIRDGYRIQSAEIEIKQQAAYVAKLEAAYLDEARENIQVMKEFRQWQQTPEAYCAEIDALAREALEKIKNERLL